VTKGSVAADAGFRAGDAIPAYDGEAVTTRFDFTNRLELFKGDRRREVRIERGTEIVGLDVPRTNCRSDT
jgi:S1-C subfamily serine protease